MFRRIGNRVRILLAVVALAAIGIAANHFGRDLWAKRHYDRATAALNRYDYDEAAEWVQRYLDLRPTDSAGLLLAGHVARRRGNLDDAFRQLLLAEKHGASADAVDRELRLLSVQDGNPASVLAMITLCEARPTDPETAIMLEAILEGSCKSNHSPTAKGCADLFLKHRPHPLDQAHGLVWLGRANWLGENHYEAIVCFRKAIELAPDYATARLWLVTAQLNYDDEEAKVHLAWLQERRPNSTSVKYHSARLYRNLGRFDEAEQLLDEILANTPSNLDVVLERGRVALDADRLEQAEHWLRRAHALAPKNRDVNFVMSDCLRQRGRLDEAKAYHERVKSIDSDAKKTADELKKLSASRE